MSSSEMVGPGGDAAAAVAERLRQRLQQEGVSEAAIADSERIVRAEFEALQKQALPLKPPQDSGNLRGKQVMEASFKFKTSLNEWRNYLCDINFWLDGYLNTPAYQDLEAKLNGYLYVQWNVGVGATACFARAISSIARDGIIRTRGPYDPVIEVDMKGLLGWRHNLPRTVPWRPQPRGGRIVRHRNHCSVAKSRVARRAAAANQARPKYEAVVGTSSLSINGKLAIKVAEQLGLLDQDYRRLKADGEELWYYTYGLQDVTGSLEGLASSLASQIFQILSTKRYLVVVENLDQPMIATMVVDDFTLTGESSLFCFPPAPWNDSSWLISATSQDVYNRSKLPYDCLIGPSCGEDMVILTLYSLHQAAKYILGAIGGHKDKQYWHHVAVRCFHYATMLLVPHCRSSHHGDVGGQQSSAAGLADNIITSDELIRQWSAQGLTIIVDTEKTGDTSTGGSTSSYDGNYSDIYQVGNVILEAFREYSLLPQLPFSLSPATTEAEEATKSAAHFLACHNLITEHHTTDELCDGDHPRLERMQWILHVGDGDQGWHLSREWLRSDDGASSGPTTLILRHCSRQSRLLAKLDLFLAKLVSSLLVLDLSYSSVESLPPSIFCLQKLQFLSLRGCSNMTSPFGFFSDTTDKISTPPLLEIIGSLLHLDVSYSNVKTFHCDFFRRMPNLQELLLLKCCNLEELPPSTAALSSLQKLELSGTQMKSFPGKMFEDMKKLGSVKIIENKELLFAPAGLFSKASGLTDVHIEGCESITEVEVALERHPTLRSFSFIGAPHMKLLSLRGCRKLEYVDIKEVGALEELDMSATAIKELPDSIPNLPQLRRLLLMGVPSLRRFPWHKLERFPDVFCLDQCSDSTINNLDHPQVAQVCISDSRLFYSFNDATKDLVRAGKLLKTFNVRVTSCKDTTRKMQDGEDMVTTNNTLQLAPAAYDDVNRRYLTTGVSMVSMDDVPPFRETERHVEISAADQYNPRCLKYLLGVTKSISMWNDNHVSCLHDLSVGLDELEECKLRWCHKMVVVFEYYKMSKLKNASVSHLKSLTHFYGPRSYYADNFNALKHLVLEDCPKLEGVLPRGCELTSLETLDILFCYNLKAVFYDYFGYSSSSTKNYQLPCLRRIRLQELPLLEHLHVDNPILTASAWEELHVRGCWSLRRLPRFSPQQPDKKKAAVKVSGERAWWNKLRWDQDQHDDAPLHRDSYEPMLPPALASHRERVVIESYLR